MPSVRVRDNEPFEVAMRRFKRTIEKTGLLTELRAREFYEKPTAERKRKLAAAVKRLSHGEGERPAGHRHRAFDRREAPLQAPAQPAIAAEDVLRMY